MKSEKALAAAVYTKFRLGLNTVQIASRMGLPEWRVSALLHRERCRLRGLPCEVEASPYCELAVRA